MGQPLGVQVPLVAPKNSVQKIYFLLAPIFIFLLTFRYTGMKGLRLFFAVLLVPLAFQAAFADDEVDTSRAATRRSTTTTVSSTRQKSESTNTLTKKTNTSSTIKRTFDTGDTKTTTRERSGTSQTVSTRGEGMGTRSAASTIPKGVSARSTTQNIQTRDYTPTQTTRNVSSNPQRTASRSAVTGRTTAVSTATRAQTTPKKSASVSRTLDRNISRLTTKARTATTTDPVEISNYQQCREVFNNCMDEFCANKDSQLKRCACSSRTAEFDGVKSSLAAAEEQLLDFSQRLLTVSMDKEDAEALYTPTEGELAFNQKDTSESKQMLDEIAKKLNNSFNDNNFNNQQLNAISLSLNTDAAFDSVDSLAGASTTAKSGTALHAAALPVCREMALEICTPDELALAESGYQMLIEQDCNTVKKAYQTQVDQARQRVFESGALLDISRLNTYQDKNSDDILTCRQKMLDMLSDSTVCGEDLGKCLDTTGRYIDPSTGQAFLTTELTDLSKLITRPDANQTWSSIPNNQRFVTFLNNKKKFLEPAMEHCQDISDYVWDLFIEDALGQIKLAQGKKLEEMRQSCTTLTTQCLSDATKSINDFDSRALSIFGVMADKTVNAMCETIQSACTSLLESTGDTDAEWLTGMQGIATDKTYETIMSTCREVGRACIIQACTSVTGNFGLCESIDNSINRKAIINGSACWQQVLDCVASAGDTALANISKAHPSDKFYDDLYGANKGSVIPPSNSANCLAKGQTCTYDRCAATGNNTYTCRLAERIWGNCENAPDTDLTGNADYHNIIKIPIDDETGTLLAWFSKNTGTSGNDSLGNPILNSCYAPICNKNYIMHCNTCIPETSLDGSGRHCTAQTFSVFGGHTNCCETKTTDSWGNCCQNQSGSNYTSQTNTTVTGNDTATLDEGKTTITIKFGTPRTGDKICVPQGSTVSPHAFATYTDGNTTYTLVCFGTVTGDLNSVTEQYPAGTKLKCDGDLIWIDQNGTYTNKTGSTTISTHYLTKTASRCVYNNTSGWTECGTNTSCPPNSANGNWYISYQQICDSDVLSDCL